METNALSDILFKTIHNTIIVANFISGNGALITRYFLERNARKIRTYRLDSDSI